MKINVLLVSSLAASGLAGCQPEKTSTPVVERSVHVTSKDGAQIAFETAGHGPPLVIISGALSHRGLLRDDELVPRLAERFTVYTYDRRGRGASTDRTPYAVEREIEDLDALITHAGRPAFLYGVSSGAALALHAAAKLGPGKVARLALYEPPYGQEPAAFATQKAGVARLVETGKPGDAAEFFMTEIGTPREAIAGMKRSPVWDEIKKIDFTLNYDFAILGDGTVPQDVTRAIAVPTLVMTGEKSMPFVHPAADQIAAEVRDAQRKTLAGQTHQVQARAVVPALLEFSSRGTALRAGR
jgi:pimeloyl-ACP methyl ester carboxylesterase